ncbi:MAG TPA: asparagine synthase (glutamine-hydrolyzing) [Gemmatimonadaceae bacterium]|nr:asparagine synthase (glutamine-hydrolyzing) [Gemmatimonadaceae bacterium]
MCGIAGLWTATDLSLDDAVRRMSGSLHHRGPDASGVMVDASAGIGLGHRRLAIVDLSPTGEQPMASARGRYVVVFNGEIYNFPALRRELEGRTSFRGASDTEVLLAAVEAWGVEGAVRRFVGMFAFALWDRAERELYLCRDQLGIKPLYYGWSGGTFLFASELKAFRAFPGFAGEIDRDSVTLLLRHNCIPAPRSIYKDVAKLLPGTLLRLRGAADREARPVAFWSAREVAERGVASPFTGTPEEAVRQLDELLGEAVALQMVADVPLGAFLSGGVDSSLVVALMQARSSRPIRTFSIGSTDPMYDEAGHAALVARHLGTEHTTLVVRPEDALAVIPKLSTIPDEPFADSSLIPTFLLSELTREHVTVSLSGDGGDELFAGYNRHVWASRVWDATRRVPMPVRRAGARALTSVRPQTWDRVFGRLDPVLPGALRHRTPGYKMHRLAGLLSADSPETLYHRLASHWTEPDAVVLDAREPATAITDRNARADLPEFADRMMYLDLITYLPDDILTKVDRASMAVSLETRVPLLDHRVVEFAWRLPLSMKLREGQSKWALRQVLYKYVPRALIERPKMGFGVPLGEWLRGPLREWADDLLGEQRLREEGFFDAGVVRRVWAEHLSGRYGWEYHLWDVLMFQVWLAEERRSGTRGTVQDRPIRASV